MVGQTRVVRGQSLPVVEKLDSTYCYVLDTHKTVFSRLATHVVTHTEGERERGCVCELHRLRKHTQTRIVRKKLQ